jgi:hypothetical protein
VASAPGVLKFNVWLCRAADPDCPMLDPGAVGERGLITTIHGRGTFLAGSDR